MMRSEKKLQQKKQQQVEKYEDLNELKTNLQVLQVRLKGDADEISQFTQILRGYDNTCGGIINQIKQENDFTVISLSKRMYTKSLLGLLYNGRLTKVKIMRARRVPKVKCSGQGQGEEEEEEEDSNNNNTEQKLLLQEERTTNNNDNSRRSVACKGEGQQLLSLATMKPMQTNILREILTQKYSREQLVDYIVKCPPEISEVYMDLLTTAPYCQQIDLALETVSKIQKLSPVTNISNHHQKNSSSSIVRQLKPSFKTEDTDEEEGNAGNENENNDINPDTRPTNLFSNQKKVMNNNNPPSPYSSQESNKMVVVVDHKFSNFPNIGRTQDSVQKNVALKQNASKSQQQQQQQQYFFRSSKTGESDNNAEEEQQQVQISSSSPLASFNQSITPHKKQVTKSNN